MVTPISGSPSTASVTLPLSVVMGMTCSALTHRLTHVSSRMMNVLLILLMVDDD
jgi:hypothetical protein